MTRALTELFIIYDADGTVFGEVAYLLKKRFFGGRCAACEITHGKHAEKPVFTSFKNASLGAPIHNIHRDEMDPALWAAVRTAGGALPAVVARSVGAEGGEGRLEVVMGPAELEMCEGDVGRFRVDLVGACTGRGIMVEDNGCGIEISSSPVPMNREQSIEMR
eukprot:CAMPEP_0184721374 /NCGR_PEP_ID=MMETSP0314-20130426/18151_1 /TAXON_ID=38298 /ORGANISM="Rhodella maculata, Strain CCMP 736" /LENGTH=162 /DNA_ID=CAMNT_0027185713 /DNA_START=120 /DNA_END=608 /DNA_ORIENTATION=+